MFDTHIDKWELIRYAEELGYDSGWVPDSQMIWSDCYATLVLAAVNQAVARSHRFYNETECAQRIT